MKINYRVLLATTLLASVFSCKKQDQPAKPEQAENLTVATAKSYFDNHVKARAIKTEDAKKLPVGEPNWDSAYSKNLNIGSGIATPLKMKSYHKRAGVEVEGVNYLLVYKDKAGNLRHEVITVIPESNHENISRFNGTVLVREWSGQILKSFIYRDGKYESANITIGSKLAVSTEKQEPCFESSTTVCIPIFGGMGTYCTYGVETSTCPGGGGVGGGPDFPGGGGSWGGEPGGGSPDPGSYPSGGPGSGGSAPNFDGAIIKSELTNPCLVRAYNGIFNSTNLSSFVSKVINEVFGKPTADVDVDLIFREKPDSYFAERGIQGQYDAVESHIEDWRNSNGTITRQGQIFINLNVDILPKTSNEHMTATFFHEALHGYLAVQKIAFGEDFRNQHETMAAQYTDKLAAAIKEIHPSISDDEAKALGWSGLQETLSWSSNRIRDLMEKSYKFTNAMSPIIAHQEGRAGTPTGCK